MALVVPGLVSAACKQGLSQEDARRAACEYVSKEKAAPLAGPFPSDERERHRRDARAAAVTELLVELNKDADQECLAALKQVSEAIGAVQPRARRQQGPSNNCNMWISSIVNCLCDLCTWPSNAGEECYVHLAGGNVGERCPNGRWGARRAPHAGALGER